MSNKKISFSQSLMRLAYDLLYNHPVESFCVWWADRYSKPLFHDNIDDYLEEELMIEWFLFRLMKDKEFKRQCEHGILDIEEMDEQWLKKEMGDLYKPPDGSKVEDRTKEIIDNIDKNGGTINEHFNNTS